MNINLEKIAKALKEYESKNNVVAVRSHENVNTCTDCYHTGLGGCKGTCRTGCQSTCYHYCSSIHAN